MAKTLLRGPSRVLVGPFFWVAWTLCVWTPISIAFAQDTEAGATAAAEPSVTEDAEGDIARETEETPADETDSTMEEQPAEAAAGESAADDEEVPDDDEVDVRPRSTSSKKPPRKEKQIIGATARLQEAQSGIVFAARVDTGAKSCSLHVEEIRVENEVEGNMDDNIGKTIRFVVQNGRDERHLCKAKIVNVVRIKNAYGIDRRYKVMLTFRCEDFDFEKRVEVSLNDRSHKAYPLLIGRNFLRDDFLVDVSLGRQD